jgi:hypothetical protein
MSSAGSVSLLIKKFAGVATKRINGLAVTIERIRSGRTHWSLVYKQLVPLTTLTNQITGTELYGWPGQYIYRGVNQGCGQRSMLAPSGQS